MPTPKTVVLKCSGTAPEQAANKSGGFSIFLLSHPSASVWLGDWSYPSGRGGWGGEDRNKLRAGHRSVTGRTTLKRRKKQHKGPQLRNDVVAELGLIGVSTRLHSHYLPVSSHSFILLYLSLWQQILYPRRDSWERSHREWDLQARASAKDSGSCLPSCSIHFRISIPPFCKVQLACRGTSVLLDKGPWEKVICGSCRTQED